MFESIGASTPLPTLWAGMVSATSMIIRPFFDRYAVGAVLLALIAGGICLVLLGWVKR